jgi:hypothetical protein
MKEKAETLKPETGGRKAKTKGVKKQEPKEQEDGSAGSCR